MKRLYDCLNEGVSKNISEVFKVAAIWSSIVGDVNAAVSMPINFQSSKLTVIVFDNIYIQGFHFIKDDIIDKLKEHKIFVQDIKFIYKAKKQNFKSHKNYRIPTENEEKFINRLSSLVKDDKIAEAYQRALRSYFKVYSLEEFLTIEKD
jgi:hypothetical protein